MLKHGELEEWRNPQSRGYEGQTSMLMRRTIEWLRARRRPIDIPAEFATVCVGEHVEAVGGSTMPPSPDSSHRHEYVLINALYRPNVAEVSATELLKLARADTLSILRILISKPWLGRFGAYYIRFYLPRGLQGGQPWVPGGRLRLYEYSIFTEGLRIRIEQMDEAYLLSNAFFREGSQVEAIGALIVGEQATRSPGAEGNRGTG